MWYHRHCTVSCTCLLLTVMTALCVSIWVLPIVASDIWLYVSMPFFDTFSKEVRSNEAHYTQRISTEDTLADMSNVQKLYHVIETMATTVRRSTNGCIWPVQMQVDRSWHLRPWTAATAATDVLWLLWTPNPELGVITPNPYASPDIPARLLNWRGCGAFPGGSDSLVPPRNARAP